MFYGEKIMRKLLFLVALPCLSFATILDMTTLKCRDMHITSITTLKQVQSTCLIDEQTSSSGLFEVDFRNDATGKIVQCYFGSNMPSSTVNGCK
jgi:hypothetical protein